MARATSGIRGRSYQRCGFALAPACNRSATVSTTRPLRDVLESNFDTKSS